MMIKRLEVTFNEDEQDLVDFLESQPLKNATYLKQLLREKMGNNEIINYNKIKEIFETVMKNYNFTPIETSKPKPQKQNNPLLNGIAQKY